MKEYKHNEELLEHLKNKNVIIDDKIRALNIIDNYSYYSIINTYKYVFKKDENMYFENVHFDEIYSLYNFDKNIRVIFLKYALEFELKIRGVMGNIIAKNYGIKDYLNKTNFDKFANEDDINNVIDSINTEIDKNKGKHPAITHYDQTYGFIPPFVAIKILSFGQISRWYGLLKQSDRNEISKKFNVSPKLLKQILINMTLARNICAHSDRLFSFHSKFFMTFNLIDNTYKINNNSTNLYMLIRSMEKFLSEQDYNDLINLINKEFDKLNESIKSIDARIILKIMGYPNV